MTHITNFYHLFLYYLNKRTHTEWLHKKLLHKGLRKHGNENLKRQNLKFLSRYDLHSLVSYRLYWPILELLQWKKANKNSPHEQWWSHSIHIPTKQFSPQKTPRAAAWTTAQPRPWYPHLTSTYSPVVIPEGLNTRKSNGEQCKHFSKCNAQFLDSGQYKDKQLQANMITLVVRMLGSFSWGQYEQFGEFH